MALLALPTELLDHIFSYLNWDRKKNIFPVRPDILHISLTCRQLRRVLVPVIFRDVVLRLRWSDGALVTPCLFRLRHEHPELAKHIRCVFIRVEFEQCAHCAAQGDPSAFRVPEGVSNWLNPSGSTEGMHHDQGPCRERADSIARRIQAASGDIEETSISAETLSRTSSKFSVLADALSIAMLCIPITTHTLIFHSLPDDTLHQTRNDFSLRVLATAIELLGNNLKDLTLISTSAVGLSLGAPRRTQGLFNSGHDQPLLTDEVVENLKIDRLTLALDRGLHSRLSYAAVKLWHGASQWIHELSLQDTSSDFNETLRCIKGFKHLRTLHIREAALYWNHGPFVAANAAGQGLAHREYGLNVWLAFLIELRQAMQHVKFDVEMVYNHSRRNPELNDQALRWILREAVPPGVLIDADRQERLLQDFDSFLPLWQAEQERGAEALRSWETQRGKLSDEAMSRRWR